MKNYLPSSLMAQLIDHEGLRNRPYRDTEGHWTVGVGHKLTPNESPMTVWTSKVIVKRLEMDIKRFEDWIFDPYHPHARIIRSLNGDRQRVLVDMAFNLGERGLMQFRKMWAALAQKDFDTAAEEMMDSRWAVQTKRRAIRLANAMRTGRFDPEFSLSPYNTLMGSANRDGYERTTA